jgi:RHS repeat-associated protein
MRYPSGRTLTYAQDDAGRVVEVKEGERRYARDVSYTAHGAMAQMKLGNELVEQWLYNSRLQPVSIRLGAAAGSDSVFGAALDYGSTDNNGNVLSQQITGLGLDRTQTYQYDGLNRLIGSGESAVWSRSFAYDERGNGWVSSWSGMSPSSFTPVGSSWFNAQNRLVGGGANYDNAGNQTAMGGYSFSYDGESRLKTSTINNYTTTYFYDGEGRRVKKVLPSGEQTLFIYDAMGQLAAEYTTGQVAPPGTRYLTVDHLGSVRAMTEQDQTVVARRDYLPFGEEIPEPLGGRTSVWGAEAGLSQKFTGKERDAETGLDYFGARYMSAAQGRFVTPDPLMASARASDPQTWNRYAYALNNPLRYVDPDGLEVPKACAEDKNCPIIVKVNVIYDSKAREGKGLTPEQKAKLQSEQLAKAKEQYKTSNIDLQMTYTPGAYTDNPGKGFPIIEGLKSDSLNLVVSDRGGAGVSYYDPGESAAVTILNINRAAEGNIWPLQMNTTEHEFGHQFTGDVFHKINSEVQYWLREFIIDSKVGQQALGTSQPRFREGIQHRRYAVPANPEANKPRQ